MSSFYRPSSAMRKTQAGNFCPACGIRMHHLDIIGFGPYFLHEQCADMLTDPDVISEENTTAAGSPIPEAPENNPG